MPVISSKALASVFDSYSCVVSVSDTTEISFTPWACSFLAASMNHFISAICWSLFSVDGWNSASIHFLASASPAQALWPSASAAVAKATAFKRNFIVCLLWYFPGYSRRAGREESPAAFSNRRRVQPLRMTSASKAIDTTKLIQIDGSCARPNQPTIFSLSATKARFT